MLVGAEKQNATARGCLTTYVQTVLNPASLVPMCNCSISWRNVYPADSSPGRLLSLVVPQKRMSAVWMEILIAYGLI